MLTPFGASTPKSHSRVFLCRENAPTSPSQATQSVIIRRVRPNLATEETGMPHVNHETKAWTKVDSDFDGLRGLPR